jgi:hypothetical protein
VSASRSRSGWTASGAALSPEAHLVPVPVEYRRHPLPAVGGRGYAHFVDARVGGEGAGRRSAERGEHAGRIGVELAVEAGQGRLQVGRKVGAGLGDARLVGGEAGVDQPEPQFGLGLLGGERADDRADPGDEPGPVRGDLGGRGVEPNPEPRPGPPVDQPPEGRDLRRLKPRRCRRPSGAELGEQPGHRADGRGLQRGVGRGR